MPEGYLKPCRISKMMSHIENSGIVRTVYSGCFQIYSRTFNNMQPYSGQYSDMLRHTEGLWGIRHYCGTLSHIRTYSELCITLAYTTVPYSETSIFRTQDSSKTYQTCRMSRHIQNPGIVRTVYSSIWKGIYGYSGILMHIQPLPGI